MAADRLQPLRCSGHANTNPPAGMEGTPLPCLGTRSMNLQPSQAACQSLWVLWADGCPSHLCICAHTVPQRRNVLSPHLPRWRQSILNSKLKSYLLHGTFSDKLSLHWPFQPQPYIIVPPLHATLFRGPLTKMFIRVAHSSLWPTFKQYLMEDRKYLNLSRRKKRFSLQLRESRKREKVSLKVRCEKWEV